MVDKSMGICIIISARLLNRSGKEPDTSALSHILDNLTKYFWVDLPAQLPVYLTVSQPQIVTDAQIERVVFYLTKKQTTPGATNAQGRSNSQPVRRSTMRRECITDSLSGQNPGNLTNLSEAEVSSLLDLVQSQIEFHRDELARLKPFLQQLQTRIPTDSFQEFLNTLE